MRQSMDDSAISWGDGRSKSKGLSFGIILEEEKLGVITQCCWVIKIVFCTENDKLAFMRAVETFVLACSGATRSSGVLTHVNGRRRCGSQTRIHRSH